MLVVDDWLKSSELLMSLLPGDPPIHFRWTYIGEHTHTLIKWHAVSVRMQRSCYSLLETSTRSFVIGTAKCCQIGHCTFVSLSSYASVISHYPVVTSLMDRKSLALLRYVFRHCASSVPIAFIHQRVNERFLEKKNQFQCRHTERFHKHVTAP